MSDFTSGSLDELAPTYTARRDATEQLWEKLVSALAQLKNESSFPEVFEQGCVYVAGSMARGEATKHSDLDVFVMDDLPTQSAGSRLNTLHLSHLLSAVDEARLIANFEEFSDGGKWLKCHSFRDMVEHIGSVEDDVSNRFTARMLLIINSRPLVGGPAYTASRARVIERYCRQEVDPARPMFPVYLINDLKRWWGVVLLTFEHKNPPASKGDTSAEATAARAKRRVNNLKLRYARILAAYTPIIGMVHASNAEGISREALTPVLDATPIERLDAIRTSTSGEAARLAAQLITRYDEYLAYMDASKSDLRAKVLADDWHDVTKRQAYEFGDLVVRLLAAVGDGKILGRYAWV